MTLSGKINTLFISLALLQCLVFTGFTAHREYQNKLDQLTHWSAAQVISQQNLQLHFYKKNNTSLKKNLGHFLDAPEIIFAAAYNGQGDLLTRIDTAGKLPKKTPTFSTLRGTSSATETTMLAVSPDGQQTGTGIWSAVAHPESLIHLTIPVLSAFDPTLNGLSDADIVSAILESDKNNSLVVIGYIHSEIEPGLILSSVKVAVVSFFWGNLISILLLSAVVIVITRRFSNSLSQLAQLSQEVTSGKCETQVQVVGDAEITLIADRLNSLIRNSKELNSDAHLSNHLLSLKVDERSSQLSLRDDELNTATQEISKTKKQLHRLVNYDSLTSLPNRRLFTEQLSLLLRLNERNKDNLALLLINLENFKRINDSLGHSAGDLVLQEVAKRLSDSLRDSDAVAYHKDSGPNIDVSHWGGDEFTVVLNQVGNSDDIGPVAQRLISKLVEPMTIEGSELVVVANIGVAIAPGDASQVEGLLSAATAAMHLARDSRHDDILFFTPEMDASGAKRIKLESDLRKALEHNEFVLHYQPQIDTVSGSIMGAEALLRWEHPEHGLIPPHIFIALAEEMGLMPELGDWTLIEACRTIKSFEERGMKLPRMALNISTTQFSAAFAKRVVTALAQAGIPPSKLELGLTEDIMTDNNGSTMAALQGLSKAGVHLSVDDFGTSHSPMSYLSRFPLNEIKIDRSFVKNADKNENDALLAKAIIAMAASLKLSTVAEGVETEEQYRFLRNNGAKVMQGYLFSKPVTAQELEALLAPWYFAEQIRKMTV